MSEVATGEDLIPFPGSLLFVESIFINLQLKILLHTKE